MFGCLGGTIAAGAGVFNSCGDVDVWSVEIICCWIGWLLFLGGRSAAIRLLSAAMICAA